MTNGDEPPSFLYMTEAWIMAGTIDGINARPALLDDVCGIPHLLRLACDAALAGCTRVFVVWNDARPAPDLCTVATDPRLARHATLALVTTPPGGNDADGILVLRADRLFHRDLPRAAISAWKARGRIGVIDGAEHDAVLVTDRATARGIAGAARESGGIAEVVARIGTSPAPPPYLAFTAAAPDRRALRRAERRLVWSLRKSADGLASKLLNRRLSLPMSYLLARTPILPNHITLIALALALIGGVVIARGGYVSGMLLVEVGSIIDGVDGELARLRFQFSRTGQWLDTIADDIGNIAYAGGVALALRGAGVTWAAPLCIAALCAFATTQLVQYALIRFVYGSGDLAAIPWAGQSTEQLSGTGIRALLPKLFKRDLVITVMLALAVVGRLDLILCGFSAGAFAFFAAFFVQLARHLPARRHSPALRDTAKP